MIRDLTIEHVRACVHAGDEQWDAPICMAVLRRRAGERPWAYAEAAAGWYLDDRSWLYLRGIVTTGALERWIARATLEANYEIDLNTRHFDLESRSHNFIATATVMGVKLEFVVRFDEGDQAFPSIESMTRLLFAPLTKAIFARELRASLAQGAQGAPVFVEVVP